MGLRGKIPPQNARARKARATRARGQSPSFAEIYDENVSTRYHARAFLETIGNVLSDILLALSKKKKKM